MVITFNIVLGNLTVPLPSWSRGKGFRTVNYPVFKFFSVRISFYELIRSFKNSNVLAHIRTTIKPKTKGKYFQTNVNKWISLIYVINGKN